MQETDLKLSQLEAVVNALAEQMNADNSACQDEDKGRGRQMLVLTICDDGSGSVGYRHLGMKEVEDCFDFHDAAQLAQVLHDMGTEVEDDRPAS